MIQREGTSLRYAPQVPDLIGVKEIRYLDHTGMVRQRSIGDLMRYSALDQDAQLGARYGDFIPAKGFPFLGTPSRYSDEQLYALALYVTRSSRRRIRTGPTRWLSEGASIRARRLWGLSHAAALHEQQADAGGGIHGSGRPSKQI